MALNNEIHKIGFSRKRFKIYHDPITIDSTLEFIDGTDDTIDQTHNLTII